MASDHYGQTPSSISKVDIKIETGIYTRTYRKKVMVVPKERLAIKKF